MSGSVFHAILETSCSHTALLLHSYMDAVADNDGKLIYDPDFLVHRRPRTTLGAFCKMLMNYGRGRAEQFRLHPTLGSAPNFVPPLFLAYLLSAPFLPLWGLWPLAAYAVVVILISHLFYGAGFWKGLFTKLKPKDQASDVEVSLERISPA